MFYWNEEKNYSVDSNKKEKAHELSIQNFEVACRRNFLNRPVN